MIRALDASSYQGAPDWVAVRASGVELVILKASEGTQNSLSTWFHQQAPKAAAAGLKVAAYHFANPAGDAGAQAAWFYGQSHEVSSPDWIRLSDGSAVPSRWLDLESGTGDLTLFARTFARWIPTLGFYSYKPFIQAHIQAGATDLGNLPLWLAAYQSSCPAPPAPWKAVSLWQNTSSASVPGILGRTDADLVLAKPQGVRPMFVNATVPSPDANGHQTYEVQGVPFDNVTGATVVADAHGGGLPVDVQVSKNPFTGNVVLTFVSLTPGQPVQPGDIGILLGVAS